MNKPVGTCGRCGGPVTVPSPWFGVQPPQARCESCGAVPRNLFGPRIDMDEPKRRNLEISDRTKAERVWYE